MSWLVPALPALREAHPGVTFQLYFGSGDDLLLRVRSLEVHCAVGSMRSTDALVTTQQLHPEKYVLVASPRLLARAPFRRPSDAASHVLFDVNLGLPLFSYLREAPGGAAFSFLRTIAMGTIAAVRELVLWGEGVAVLPEYLVLPDFKAGRLQRVLPRQQIQQDWFRLYFRSDEPRVATFKSIARALKTRPLQ